MEQLQSPRLVKSMMNSKGNIRLRHGMLTVRATKIGQHTLTLSSYVKVLPLQVSVCQIVVLKHSCQCIVIASMVVLCLSFWFCFGYTREESGSIMVGRG